MDLVEFLRARIDEDEQAAWAASRSGYPPGTQPREWHEVDPLRYAGKLEDDLGGVITRGEGLPTARQAEHIARHDPARVLAEVDAKRRIVAGCAQARHAEDQARANALFVVACLLALPYADHPDYRQEWKP
jgi:uncharacterized protein DUF6221